MPISVTAVCFVHHTAIRYAAGSGYKLMCVVEGWADAYLLSKASSYKWDTCAPHAILRALGMNTSMPAASPIVWLFGEKSSMVNC